MKHLDLFSGIGGFALAARCLKCGSEIKMMGDVIELIASAYALAHPGVTLIPGGEA